MKMGNSIESLSSYGNISGATPSNISDDLDDEINVAKLVFILLGIGVLGFISFKFHQKLNTESWNTTK